MRPQSTADAVGTAHGANLALRFVLELAALAALAYWGFHSGDSVAADLVLGVGAPVLAACVWGALAAPKSSRRLSGPALLAVQLAVLCAGAIALVAAGRPVLGAALAALIAANTVLLHVLEEDNHEHS